MLYDPVMGYFDCPSVLDSPDEAAAVESAGQGVFEVSSSSAQNNQVISDCGQKDLTISDMSGLMDDFSNILNECVISGIKMEYLLSANPQAPCQSVDTLPILTKKYVNNLVKAVTSRLKLSVAEVTPDMTILETQKPPEVPARPVQQPVTPKPVEKDVEQVIEKPTEPPVRAVTPEITSQPVNPSSQPVSAAEFFRRHSTQPHGPAPRLSAVELDDSNPFKPYLLSQNQSTEIRAPPGFFTTGPNNVESRPQTPNAARTTFDQIIKMHQDFNAQKANQANRSIETQREIDSSTDLIEKSWASESNSSDEFKASSINSAKSLSPVNSRVSTPRIDLLNGSRESLVKEIDLIPVTLSKITVCFFCFDNCGWITMDHFRLAFTKFGDNEAIYRYFKLIGIEMPLRILTQTENPRLFHEYTKINVKQMKNLREEVSGALSMVTLEFMLRMLRQLGAVSLGDLKNLAETPSPAMVDLNALLKAFGEYQKSRSRV